MTREHKIIQALLLSLVPTAFLVPPLQLGVRKVFLFDAVSLVLAIILAMKYRVLLFRSFWFWCFALMSLLAWAHGFFRPTDLGVFELHGVVTVAEPLNFQFFRELVIAIRFFVWGLLIGLLKIYLENQPREHVEQFQYRATRVVTAAILLAVGTAGMGQLSPDARRFFGKVFGYNPDIFEWQFRAFGVFQSPVEAGAVYAFLAILFWFHPRLRGLLRGVVLLVLMTGVSLTHSLTPLLAVFTVFGVFLIERVLAKKDRKILFIAVAIAAVLAVASLKFINIVKVANFIHRTRVWDVYWGILTSRIDHALLGIGFWPVHSDSSIVFLLSRYGVLGFVLFGVFFFKKFLSGFESRHELLRYTSLFGLVTALTTDVWIYRPIIAVLVGFYLPLFVTVQRGKT